MWNLQHPLGSDRVDWPFFNRFFTSNLRTPNDNRRISAITVKFKACFSIIHFITSYGIIEPLNIRQFGPNHPTTLVFPWNSPEPVKINRQELKLKKICHRKIALKGARITERECEKTDIDMWIVVEREQGAEKDGYQVEFVVFGVFGYEHEWFELFVVVNVWKWVIGQIPH